MATLVSPGVSISVSDESFYAAAGAGSVPLIVIASASSVPSISALPDTSKEPESNSPVKVICLRPAISRLVLAIKALPATAFPADAPVS